MKKSSKICLSFCLIIGLIVIMLIFITNDKNVLKDKTESSNNDNYLKNDELNNEIDIVKDNVGIVGINESNFILKKVYIKVGEKYNLEDFIENDIGSEYTLSYSDEKMSKYTDKGNYKIEIIIKDKDGKKIKKETELTIDDSVDNVDNEDNNTSNKNNNSITNDTIKYGIDNSITNSSTNNIDDNELNNNNSYNINSNDKCIDKIKSNQNPSNLNNFIKFDTEEKTLEPTYKYGVKIERTLYITYAIFSDVGKCKYSEETYENIDRSKYTATTNELKSEAINILNSNLNSIKEIGINTLNSYRREANKFELVYDYELSLAATIRAMEMYWSNTKSHTRPNGSSCFTIYDEMGINYTAAGENIAWGYENLSKAMVGWKNSNDHYLNIISDNYKKVGIGFYNNNYVTLFG